MSDIFFVAIRSTRQVIGMEAVDTVEALQVATTAMVGVIAIMAGAAEDMGPREEATNLDHVGDMAEDVRCCLLVDAFSLMWLCRCAMHIHIDKHCYFAVLRHADTRSDHKRHCLQRVALPHILLEIVAGNG
jgi:hypothetical protein